MTLPTNGGERRFMAFLSSLLVIMCSGFLGLTEGALTALVTLSLGYIVQGAAKDTVIGVKVGQKETKDA